MITMLLTALLYIGAAAIAGLLVYVAALTLEKLLNRIKKLLEKHFGDIVIYTPFQKVANQLRAEAQKQGNIVQLDELLAKVNKQKGQEKIIEIVTDKSGKIPEGGLKILSTDEISDDLREQMDKHGGELIIENKAG